MNALEASGTMKNITQMKKVINSKIGQENEEIRYQDHDFDFFWVPLDSIHFPFG